MTKVLSTRKDLYMSGFYKNHVDRVVCLLVLARYMSIVTAEKV